MGILEQLLLEETWQRFYERKLVQDNLTDRDAQRLRAYIDRRAYVPMIGNILGGGAFSHARRHEVNKTGTGRKRVVYSFGEEENILLKAVSFLLYRYDGLFAPNLFSFRRDYGVGRAVEHLRALPPEKRAWSYKIDVHNYFNSVDVSLCLPLLREALADDPALYRFLSALLLDPLTEWEGQLVEEHKGIMAGTPVSAFLANLYLSQMDRDFWQRGIPYARYSDDIIVFASCREELEDRRDRVLDWLARMGLTVNPEKEVCTAPGEPWVFLGIRFLGDQVGLAPVSLEKVKGRMRRKARALIRWKHKKQLEGRHSARAFVKYLNRYFYDNRGSGRMTWARWYFPLLTTDEDLRAIDRYAQELIRYVYFEAHKKSNYDLRYEQLKQLGYRPLVAEYYRSRQAGR